LQKVRNKRIDLNAKGLQQEPDMQPFAPRLLEITMVFSSVLAPLHNVDGADIHGLSLKEGWLEPPVQSHFSPTGTPLVHSFRLEPAFTHRDLFIDYSYLSGEEGDEQEIEVELEWALTRRLGLVFELPYVLMEPSGGKAVEGFGDLALSPRFLLAGQGKFILSFNLEIETTTGTNRQGIGNDEAALAPSLSTWIGLGERWAFNSQIGVGRTLQTWESELLFRASIVYTPGNAGSRHHHEPGEVDGHQHLGKGQLGLIFELDGAVDFAGEEKGDAQVEGIAGVYFGLGEKMGIRAGYIFPLSSPHDDDHGLTIGVIWHY
jgi:hypothetical protein